MKLPHFALTIIVALWLSSVQAFAQPATPSPANSHESARRWAVHDQVVNRIQALSGVTKLTPEEYSALQNDFEPKVAYVLSAGLFAADSQAKIHQAFLDTVNYVLGEARLESYQTDHWEADFASIAQSDEEVTAVMKMELALTDLQAEFVFLSLQGAAGELMLRSTAEAEAAKDDASIVPAPRGVMLSKILTERLQGILDEEQLRRLNEFVAKDSVGSDDYSTVPWKAPFAMLTLKLQLSEEQQLKLRTALEAQENQLKADGRFEAVLTKHASPNVAPEIRIEAAKLRSQALAGALSKVLDPKQQRAFQLITSTGPMWLRDYSWKDSPSAALRSILQPPRSNSSGNFQPSRPNPPRANANPRIAPATDTTKQDDQKGQSDWRNIAYLLGIALLIAALGALWSIGYRSLLSWIQTLPRAIWNLMGEFWISFCLSSAAGILLFISTQERATHPAYNTIAAALIPGAFLAAAIRWLFSAYTRLRVFLYVLCAGFVLGLACLNTFCWPKDPVSVDSLPLFLSGLLLLFLPPIGSHLDNSKLKNRWIQIREPALTTALCVGLPIAYQARTPGCFEDIDWIESARSELLFEIPLMYILAPAIFLTLLHRMPSPPRVRAHDYFNYFHRYVLIPLVLIAAAVLWSRYCPFLGTNARFAILLSSPYIPSFFFFGTLIWIDSWDDEGDSFLINRFFRRAFFVVALPLTALVLFGLGTRVQRYGFTEPRYYGLMVYGWFGGMALVTSLSRHFKLSWLPASLLTLMLLSSFGPWGASQVSENSQLEGLRKLVNETQLDKVPLSKRVSSIPVTSRQRLFESVNYIVGRYNPECLKPIFDSSPEAQAILQLASSEYGRSEYFQHPLTQQLFRAIGLESSPPSRNRNEWSSEVFAISKPTSPQNDPRQWELVSYGPYPLDKPSAISSKGTTVRFETNTVIIDSPDESPVVFALLPKVFELRAQHYDGATSFLPPKELEMQLQQNGRLYSIQFQRLTLTIWDQTSEVQPVVDSIRIGPKGSSQ